MFRTLPVALCDIEGTVLVQREAVPMGVGIREGWTEVGTGGSAQVAQAPGVSPTALRWPIDQHRIERCARIAVGAPQGSATRTAVAGRQKMTIHEVLVRVPDSVLIAEKVDEAAFARELPLLAAVKLYELGRLSSGRAAELAGMSRVAFLLGLGRFEVFPFQAELDEIEAASG
jgi:predicted HTH domain antitoxin